MKQCGQNITVCHHCDSASGLADFGFINVFLEFASSPPPPPSHPRFLPIRDVLRPLQSSAALLSGCAFPAWPKPRTSLRDGRRACTRLADCARLMCGQRVPTSRFSRCPCAWCMRLPPDFGQQFRVPTPQFPPRRPRTCRASRSTVSVSSSSTLPQKKSPSPLPLFHPQAPSLHASCRPESFNGPTSPPSPLPPSPPPALCGPTVPAKTATAELPTCHLRFCLFD